VTSTLPGPKKVRPVPAQFLTPDKVGLWPQTNYLFGQLTRHIT
jgi:hypothetical protein